MLLTSAAGIRDSLGFDDMTDINAAIEMALNAAEPLLAALLNTSFARTEVTDVFWVREPVVIDGPHVKTEFWLSRGFVRSGSPVISDHPTDKENITFELERGVAKDRITRYSNSTISIGYSAGFDVQDTDPKSYVFEQVPNWLQEAAKMQAMIFLADSAPVTEAGIKIDVKVYQEQLQSLMVPRIRYAPLALYPL